MCACLYVRALSACVCVCVCHHVLSGCVLKELQYMRVQPITCHKSLTAISVGSQLPVTLDTCFFLLESFKTLASCALTVPSFYWCRWEWVFYVAVGFVQQVFRACVHFSSKYVNIWPGETCVCSGKLHQRQCRRHLFLSALGSGRVRVLYWTSSAVPRTSVSLIFRACFVAWRMVRYTRWSLPRSRLSTVYICLNILYFRQRPLAR